MAIGIYDATGTTLVSEEPITSFVAGGESDIIGIQVWNDKGNPAADPIEGLLLGVYTEDPAAAGKRRRSGVTPQDELWMRARYVGQTNTSHPEQAPFNTDWQSVGAYRLIEGPAIYGDCSRHLELRWRPPASAPAAIWRFWVALYHDEHALAVPVGLGALPSGILTGVGDAAESHLVRGGVVSASATPDDEVHVAARTYVWRGRVVGQIGTSHTVDQDDAAAAALSSGESYWALLSLGASGVTVTKGLLGAAATKPTPPAGEIPLRHVHVEYQAGGTSVIGDEDLDGELVYGRLHVAAGVGREARIHPGRAVAGGTWRTWQSVEAVGLSASTTSHLWQVGTGRYEATTDTDAPDDTALGPIAEVDTDASDVTAIRDRRTYARGEVTLRLAGGGPGVAGVVAELTVGHSQLWIERVLARASDGGGGSAGQTVLDVEVDGSTIYPSSATEDHRPTFAYDATGAGLRDDDGFPEVTELRQGQLVTLRAVEVPTGGSPADLEVVLVCRAAQ